MQIQYNHVKQINNDSDDFSPRPYITPLNPSKSLKINNLHKMGNEVSHLNGLEIEEKATETTDFWSHYQALIRDSCRYFSLKGDGSVSVFKGQAALGPLWAVSTPLEKFSNNLLKFRHPCIIRYISAWQQRSTLHLATEYVQPLSQVIKTQTPQQICIGLNNILQALVFLHEQAGMSHNNVSTSAIYVTGDGQWKLGDLQYLSPFHELTSAYLKQARIHRYDKAVDPNEDSYDIITKVDQYAFAVLVDDVFKGHGDDEVPHLKDFRSYCRDFLQHSNPSKRPNLFEVQQHNFFNHEFITIYKFLILLPLKNEEEKEFFFSNILTSLKPYDEETVAKQLSGLLLSRLTMLDPTARREVVPYVLKPRNERVTNGENTGIFSLSVYKEHVKPRLMQLFAVRDIQIRVLLLTHFSKFVHVFTHEELSQHILPELLVGIKDTDDSLVASTLICLSELVPILGADTVVGGKRSKYFTDGRPNSKQNRPLLMSENTKTAKSLHDFHCSKEIPDHSRDSFDKSIDLNERPSPVGGESVDDDNNPNFSEDDWGDWDNTNNHKLVFVESPDIMHEPPEFKSGLIENKSSENLKNLTTIAANTSLPEQAPKTILMQKAAFEAKKHIVDISELDIKNQKSDHSARRTGDEFDFFADMTPVIEKTTFIDVEEQPSQAISSKLNFIPDDALDENEGWGENWND